MLAAVFLIIEKSMYYKDLSLYIYKLSSPVESVFNIGWLSKDQDFSKGRVSPEFLNKLKSVIVGNADFDANFNRIRGVHPCSLCGERNSEIEYDGQTEMLGMSEVLVPMVSGNDYFAAPSMVYHYIVEHDYLPPKEYLKAVNAVDLRQKYFADNLFNELLCSREGRFTY